MVKTTTNNDFNPDELTQKTDEHTKQLNDLKNRIKAIETKLVSPDQVGQMIADSVEKSSPLRKQLSSVIIELLNDHDTRVQFKKVIAKIDREMFWRWGKYILAFIVGAATVLAAIFGYIAITKPN